MGKYWVDQEYLDMYCVITDAWCDIAGHFYEMVKGGFDSQELAQVYADELNSKE